MKLLKWLSFLFMAVAIIAFQFDLPFADFFSGIGLLSGVTLVGDLSNQVGKLWAPLTVDELKERAVMASLTNRDYEGQINNANDTVYVTQFQVGEASRKQVGSGHESYTTNLLGSARISIVANQVFSHAIELDDLVPLQTQMQNPESELRSKMEAAIARKVDAYIYSLVSPSTTSPDHLLGGVTDFNATALLNVRKLASQAKWPEDVRRIQLLDPQYMNDLLSATTLTSADYASDSPSVMGKFGLMRHGFEIYENNADAFLDVDTGATATADVGLAFTPDFIHTVLGAPEWSVVDNKPNGKFTYSLVLKVLGGAVAGHDHASKCIVTRGTA